ncbi:aminopeptidase P family protein [Vibrio hangzhouensis]|uniref:Xaa-Pro aminopeptidase n=1 Tax=Vibrio hangzhouensis TaxID=462991 RepID=A0A1H6CIJ7_9VIBR|nr:aminopeptidase P family protein [Vibrio hangzhouensis]SEG72525.1 Xaa-Pro aminopeptidase [Vibrio hangzhouensis]
MQEQISRRVELIQAWLADNELDAFIVAHEDEYLGEYVPEHNERLHWLTQFTGSAGAAVITRQSAAIFVDGRYTVQVRKQVPAGTFEYCHLIEQPPIAWAKNTLEPGSRIGVDPRMHRGSWFQHALEQLGSNFELIATDINPVDLFWSDRPAPQLSQLMLMSLDKVGQSSADKRSLLGAELAKSGADAAIITELDSICWLLNVRGLDVSRLPVLLSHAILYSDGTTQFFIDESRIEDRSAFDTHVGLGVDVCNPDSLEHALKSLSGKTVTLDPGTSNAWFKLKLTSFGAILLEIADPCLMPKAAKNETEIEGMRNCHVRDGAAMVNFLSWLDTEVASGQLYDEAFLADKLEAFRRVDPSIVDLSFDTISASAGNAAMCHYNHENQEVPGSLLQDTLYLVDSGGQYIDGTTDITRTIAIGTPSEEMKRQFTLVLKGHISLATALFPKGTCGHQLDVLARQHLWANGYDYDHGTGHGVGHFLSVHEGPQRIAKAVNNTPLVAGMVLSNEPGYYRADEFGIRIENLELVVDKATNGDSSMLGFESLTRCPIDKRNIVAELLTETEIAWLNDYHQIVWNEVSPLVTGDALIWLESACQPL